MKWRRNIKKMNNYLIYTTKNFENEFNNILNYIHFILKEPYIAVKLYNKIINKLFSLNIFPERYPLLLNYENSNIRKLLIDNFIIVYKIDNQFKQIFILHIFHNNQNYLNLI